MHNYWLGFTGNFDSKKNLNNKGIEVSIFFNLNDHEIFVDSHVLFSYI